MLDSLDAWFHSLAVAEMSGARLGSALVAGLLAWAAVYVAIRVLLEALARIARRTKTRLDDDLIERIRAPLQWFGPVAGVHAAAMAVAPTVAGIAKVAEGLLFTYVAVAAFEVLVLEAWLVERQGMRVPPLVRQVSIGVIYAMVLLGAAGQVFGIDITPLLATGSVTTVVVGLALQAPLSNLFAGLMLHVERHPEVGDWLMVDNREGQVLEIGWRTTRLRLFSQDLLVVPNSALLGAQVINFTANKLPSARLVQVPVPYEVSPERFEGWVREVLASVDGVLAEPSARIRLASFDDSCQTYVIKLFVRDFAAHDDVESDVRKAIWRRFEREGVEFPFPHRVVELAKGSA